MDPPNITQAPTARQMILKSSRMGGADHGAPPAVLTKLGTGVMWWAGEARDEPRVGVVLARTRWSGNRACPDRMAIQHVVSPRELVHGILAIRGCVQKNKIIMYFCL